MHSLPSIVLPLGSSSRPRGPGGGSVPLGPSVSLYPLVRPSLFLSALSASGLCGLFPLLPPAPSPAEAGGLPSGWLPPFSSCPSPLASSPPRSPYHHGPDWIHVPFPELACAQSRVINSPGPSPALCSLIFCVSFPPSPLRCSWLLLSRPCQPPAQHIPRARRSPELAAPFGTGRAGVGAVLPALFFLPAFQIVWVGMSRTATHVSTGISCWVGLCRVPALTVAGLFLRTQQGWVGGCTSPGSLLCPSPSHLPSLGAQMAPGHGDGKHIQGQLRASPARGHHSWCDLSGLRGEEASGSPTLHVCAPRAVDLLTVVAPQALAQAKLTVLDPGTSLSHRQGFQKERSELCKDTAKSRAQPGVLDVFVGWLVHCVFTEHLCSRHYAGTGSFELRHSMTWSFLPVEPLPTVPWGRGGSMWGGT